MKWLLMVPIMKLAWLKPMMHAEELPGVPPTRYVPRNCTKAPTVTGQSWLRTYGTGRWLSVVSRLGLGMTTFVFASPVYCKRESVSVLSAPPFLTGTSSDIPSCFPGRGESTRS